MQRAFQDSDRISGIACRIFFLNTAITNRHDTGSVGEPGGADLLPTVARGEKLCCAYELYRTTIPAAQISFEHAVFLAVALTRGDQLRLSGCRECGGLIVTERLPLSQRRCHYCSNPALAGQWRLAS